MYSRDVETYMSYCDRKGLAQRTLHSYDQTLRMFGMYLETIGIKNTEDICGPYRRSGYQHEI